MIKARSAPLKKGAQLTNVTDRVADGIGCPTILRESVERERSPVNRTMTALCFGRGLASSSLAVMPNSSSDSTTLHTSAASEGRPTVSVILPTFNRSGFLRAALESIRGQALTDWDLIVIDDGS